MTTIKVTFKAELEEIAKQIAKQHHETEVLEFLKDLDDAMESWDFTDQAVQVLVSRSLDMHRQDDQSIPTARAGLARVKEFMRQAGAQNHVDAGHPITSVWTDPKSEGAPLLMADLALVLELAASALAREEK